MRGNWKIISAFAVLAVLAAIYSLGGNKDKAKTLSPRAVETVTVEAQTQRPGGYLAGIVKPHKDCPQENGRRRGTGKPRLSGNRDRIP